MWDTLDSLLDHINSFFFMNTKITIEVHNDKQLSRLDVIQEDKLIAL